MAASPVYRWDLFITCAPSDAAWVRSYLIPAIGLPRERVRQTDDFKLGASFPRELERAVKGSRYTLLVLSPAFLVDQWALYGEQLATTIGVTEQAERIIPLVRHPCELPLRIEFRVRLDCTEEGEWAGQAARLRGLFELPEPEEVPLECPYPGLAPFTAERESNFYGREEEIQFVLEHLRHQKFLFALGPSGSGKSSLITAGVLPKLPASGYFQKRPWLVRPMRPGAAPWQSLGQALGGDPNTPGETLGTLLSANPEYSRVLLVIDQFEELFTQAAAGEQRDFIAAIKRLRDHDAAAVIATMRADFYADLMKSDLWPIPPSQRLEVGPLKGDALRRAIELPAQNAGVHIEDRLVDRLIADASDAPGALPLLQETMVQLWERRQRLFLPYSAYVSLGGGAGSGLAAAIARKADQTLEVLSPSQQQIACRIFLRLVQFGEGRAHTRRQQPVEQLRAGMDSDEAFDKVLEHLSDNRLVSLSGGDTPGEDRVADIAHEALFQNWPRLAGWISELREAELRRRELDPRVVEWVAARRSTERLLTSAQVQQTRTWLTTPQSEVVGHHAALREFVDLSHAHLRRNRRILSGLVAAVIGVTLVGAILFASTRMTAARTEYNLRLTAVANEESAVRARLTAEANRVYALDQESQARVELARQQLALDPLSSLQLSLSALPSDQQPRPYHSSAELVLREALQTSLEVTSLKPEDSLNALQVAPDGPLIAAGRTWLRLYTQDVVTATSPIEIGFIDRLSWHEDGALLVISGQAVNVWRNGAVYRTDLAGRVTCATWRPGRPEVLLCEGPNLWLWAYTESSPRLLHALSSEPQSSRWALGIEPAIWSSDGLHLAAWDRNGQLFWWSATDELSGTLTLPAPAWDGRWSEDSTRLAVATELGEAVVYEPAQSDQPLATLSIGPEANASASTNGGLEFIDSNTLLTWGFGDPLKRWSLDEPDAPAFEYARGSAPIATVKLERPRDTILLFRGNGDIEIVPLRDGEIARLTGHTRRVTVSDWRGNYLATGSVDGTVRVWDTRDSGASSIFYPKGAQPGPSQRDILAVRWMPDGRLFAAAEDGRLELWQPLDAEGNPWCFGAVGPEGRVACGYSTRVFGGDGTSPATVDDARWLGSEIILAADDSGVARRVNLATGKVLVAGEPRDPTDKVAWSRDGTQLLRYPSELILGDEGGWILAPETAEAPSEIAGPVTWAQWTAAGLLVSRGAGTLALLEPETGQTIRLFEDSGDGTSVDAQARGSRLVVSDDRGVIRAWNLETGEQFPIMFQQEDFPVKFLQWHPGGNRLAGAGLTVVMWDTTTGQRLWEASGRALDVSRPQFSPDGQLLAGSVDSDFFVLRADSGDTVWRASADRNTPVLGVQWISGVDWENGRERPLLLTWSSVVAQLWDVRARDEIMRAYHYSGLRVAAVSPDGDRLFTAGAGGQIRVWDVWLARPERLRDEAARRLAGRGP